MHALSAKGAVPKIDRVHAEEHLQFIGILHEREILLYAFSFI